MSYRRHPLDIGPLVFGLIFLGIVAAWGLFELDVVSGADAAWILPVVMIAAGALGVVLAATKQQRVERRMEAWQPVTAPAGHHTAERPVADESATADDTWPFGEDETGNTHDTTETTRTRNLDTRERDDE